MALTSVVMMAAVNNGPYTSKAGQNLSRSGTNPVPPTFSNGPAWAAARVRAVGVRAGFRRDGLPQVGGQAPKGRPGLLQGAVGTVQGLIDRNAGLLGRVAGVQW